MHGVSGQSAREAWRLMFDVFVRTHPARAAALGRRGLTPNDSRALFSLEREQPQPIGALAKLWECDPSTATWVVDRLQKRGLATRTTPDSDRRIKLVSLTPEGDRLRAELAAEFAEPPEIFGRLDAADLTALANILQKML